ncbi:hypothetical protein [Comamonas jiangduensis]|uniref:hypothetical protein n=1 Tax=Comamonas jiangduensis TaxID=1194168 RepID=UPI003BF83B21
MNEPKPEFASFAKQMQAGFLDWMTYLCVYIPGALLLLNVHMYDLFFPLLHFKVYLAVVIIPSIPLMATQIPPPMATSNSPT